MSAGTDALAEAARLETARIYAATVRERREAEERAGDASPRVIAERRRVLLSMDDGGRVVHLSRRKAS